jgi:hypothetical protein
MDETISPEIMRKEGVNELTRSINIIETRKEDMDEEDLDNIINVITSFNLGKKSQIKLKGHLEQLGEMTKKPGGPGRGRTKDVREVETLEEAAKRIGNHCDKLLEETKLGLMKTLICSISDKDRLNLVKVIGQEEYNQVKKNRGMFKIKSLEDVSSVNFEEYYNECNDVVKSFMEGMIDGNDPKRTGRAKNQDLWKLTIVEICDRVKRLQSRDFISPIGLGRNYFIHKLTGSRLAVDVIGATDGSGKYETLHRVEEASADAKVVNVLPADIRLTSDNEQVLSGNYRIFGNTEQRKLQVNVINNWMASYVDTGSLGKTIHNIALNMS